MKLHNMMAVSLDGKIASHSGEDDVIRRKTGFTNSDDHARVVEELKKTDAVIVGAKTLRASSSVWDVKNHKGQYPIWIIFSNSGIDKKFPFWEQQHVHRVIVSKCPLDHLEWPDSSVENWCYGQEKPALFAYNKLRKMKITQGLLFGGGSINAMFYEDGLVDSLDLTLVPQILGSELGSQFVDSIMSHGLDLELQSSQVSNNHVFLNYTVKKH